VGIWDTLSVLASTSGSYRRKKKKRKERGRRRRRQTTDYANFFLTKQNKQNNAYKGEKNKLPDRHT